MRVGRQLLYAATLAGIALGARSVLKGPVPIEVAIGSAATFSTLVLVGVVEPRLAMFADVVNHGPRAPQHPRVALTFDDGPGPSTPHVLDLLDEAGVKGTFFVVGRKLTGDGAAIVKDAHARGHAIGCHSFAHDRLFALRGAARVRDDLRRALAAIGEVTGEAPKLFRPPIGHTNPTIARVAEELDLTVVGFSVRGLDGLSGARPGRVAKRIVRGLRDGAIALLHDAAERDDFTPASIAALPVVLDEMARRELAGVTVEAMLDEPAVR